MENIDLLKHAAELVRQASAVILDIRARGFQTAHKQDSSPVTEADHAAEALIVAGLRRLTPDIPVVAEEEMAAGHVPLQAQRYWLVDPLDGTREFSQGRDEFTVNIGLCQHKNAILGVVGVPATGEIFGGIPGLGAWKQDQAGRRPIQARHVPAEGMDVLVSRHHGRNEQQDAFLRAYPVASVTPMGSALKICRVAEGVADLYPRFGPTMEWDTAAPQAVLEAAGGHLSLMDGTPFVYGKPDWLNPPFICTGRREKA